MTERPPLDAASYAAGEGTPAETLAFDARLAHDPALQREVAFWRMLQRDLAPTDPPPAPDLANAILRRATLERRDPRPVRTPRWVLPTAAAAALLVGLGGWALGKTAAPPAPLVEVVDEPIAYAEDGSGITPPPSSAMLAHYLPLAGSTAIETATPRTLPDAPRPWIGLWTRPARLLVRGEPRQEAHVVLRVVGGSPAWNAGLRPGDMLLTFNGCPLMTPVCLAHALATCAPGDSVPVTYWSGEKGALVNAQLTLEAVHD